MLNAECIRGLKASMQEPFRLLGIIVLTTVLNGLAHAEQDKIVRIATGEYPPFTSELQSQHNLINQIVVEAFAESGIKVEFHYFPWARTYKEAQTGKYDASSYWYVSPERAVHFYYSDSVITSPTYFFYLKSKPFEWATIADLKGKAIAVTRGYTYTAQFIQAGNEGLYGLDWANSDQQNIKKLAAGRVDLFPMELSAASLILAELPPHQAQSLTYHPTPLVETTGHLIFPKKRKSSLHLLEIFNKGLAILKSNGRLEALHKSTVDMPCDRSSNRQKQ